MNERSRSAPIDVHVDDVNDFFGMSLDHLCVAGFDGYFRRVNASWTRTLGWTEDELLSRPSIELVHPEDRAATLAGRHSLTSGAGMGPLVNRYQCKDGTYRWFEWRSVGHTERGLVYAAARDITEQKLAEASLREAKELQEKLERQLVFSDRMASVGMLAAGVAHQINSPLSCVTANIEMISDALAQLGPATSTATGVDLMDMLREAQVGAERIRTVVLGFKTFSRSEEERRAVIDIRPVVELAVDITESEIRHRAQLVKDFGPTPLVDADEARLGQVFINLLVNAAQALSESNAAANQIRIETSTDAMGRAVIAVHDTGAGIPAALIGRVFDPFFTTKPVGIGTGLGLSICHDIVTAMGGEISVASDPGRGTTFRVALPAAPVVIATAAPVVSAAAAPVVSATAGARPSSAKGTSSRAAVLVVDDDASVGNVLRRVLREHEVTVVTSATDALGLLRSGHEFDVILSDLMMPQMSGMEFYDEVAHRFPHVAERVVFVSGGAFTSGANAFLDRVPNERIDKPFDPKNVRDVVQRFLR